MKLLLVALEIGMTGIFFNSGDSEVMHRKQIIKLCFNY